MLREPYRLVPTFTDFVKPFEKSNERGVLAAIALISE
jgi:hypothetical protein